jgi:hypothetical protein
MIGPSSAALNVPDEALPLRTRAAAALKQGFTWRRGD